MRKFLFTILVWIVQFIRVTRLDVVVSDIVADVFGE